MRYYGSEVKSWIKYSVYLIRNGNGCDMWPVRILTGGPLNLYTGDPDRSNAL